LFYSTRAKLIISFIGVSVFVGVVSLFIGGQLLYRSVLNEATRRVSLDLNAAREIYNSEIERIKISLNIAVLDADLRASLVPESANRLVPKLIEITRRGGLDFAGIALEDGKILCKTGPTPVPERLEITYNPVVSQVLKKETEVAGTVILEETFLRTHNPELANRARITIQPTPKAAPVDKAEETSGMALVAGIPLYHEGKLSGVLYGGTLLNRHNQIVDRIRDTVFQNEKYEGRSVGTATIFYRDLRISTNVLTPEGERAIGTRVSKEVRDRVLLEGERWTDRAFVVSDWYITAYEPITDIFNERVGMLYVGVLEKKYIDIRKNLLKVFILITISGVVVGVGLGFLMTNRMIHAVHRLILASNEVASGNLNPEIGPISKSEIGILQKNFSQMLSALRKRDELLRAERESMLLQSEKQAGIGRLAAGVAHEINNPLTGVLTFTHMLLKRRDITDEVRADLETIARETERVRKIVKGLLDFARETKLEPEPTDINLLVKSAIGLVENQAIIKGITLKFLPGENIPVRTVDRNQLQSAILNIILNAFDATGPGGTITVSTNISVSAGTEEKKGIEISISDTGCGIPPENLDKIFDPFFTTKEVGHGTGLGLAVTYGIVERHGGSIRVQSKVGKGSTFTIWLPLEEENISNQ